MTTAAFKVKLKTHIFKNFLYSAVTNECWNSVISMSRLVTLPNTGNSDYLCVSSSDWFSPVHNVREIAYNYFMLIAVLFVPAA